MMQHLPAANFGGLEDFLGQGGEVLSEGMLLLLLLFIAARAGGVGSQAECAAPESLGRIRLSRCPHTNT